MTPIEIVSPKESVIYALNHEGEKLRDIPLLATTDASVKAVHWFANTTYLGQTQSGATFLWSPKPGNYTIRAVDDMGQSVAQKIEIALNSNKP